MPSSCPELSETLQQALSEVTQEAADLGLQPSGSLDGASADAERLGVTVGAQQGRFFFPPWVELSHTIPSAWLPP